MDKVSDIYIELKDRLSSPIFFSFIISWCVINWRVIIGLLFYKSSDLKIDGYSSYIDLISTNYHWSNTIIIPLTSALLYTFFYPIVRNCIYAFNTWTKKWGNNWNLKLSRTSNISIGKYIALRDTYKERTELLNKVLTEEGEYLNQIETLRNDVLKVQEENISLKQQIGRWTAVNDANSLNGEWEYSELLPLAKKSIFYKVTIAGYQIDFHNRDGRSGCQISNFYSDPNSNRLSFVLKSYAKAGHENIEIEENFTLQRFKESTVLKGKINNSIEVELTKKK